MFRRAGTATGNRRRIEPDWAALACNETTRRDDDDPVGGVPRVQSNGNGYSRFCEPLFNFNQQLTPVMRYHRVTYERSFADYSGKRIRISASEKGDI